VPTLFVRPAAVLPEGHRIIVALRDLVDADGEPVAADDAFRAYRDRLESDVAEVEDRRQAMEQVFADLAEAKVKRDDLVLAWDFTIASAETLSARLLHIRDDAFERLGDEAPPFTVETNEASDREGIAREVTGTFEVPLYLGGDGGPGTEFELDDDGLPTHTGSYTANFHCIVPDVATADEPAGAGLYGHGLLGSADQVPAAGEVATAGNRIFCGTDLIGMAEDDIGNAVKIVSELSTFNALVDRLQQGHLNTLVLGRLMISSDGLGSDPAFQDRSTSLLTDDLIYYGISQGGIMGAATTAVAQDWTYAALGVPAANYSLLLDRSVDFDPFRTVFEPAYPATHPDAVGPGRGNGVPPAPHRRPLCRHPGAPGPAACGVRRPPGGQRGHRGRGPLHRRCRGPADPRRWSLTRRRPVLGRSDHRVLSARGLGSGHVGQRRRDPADGERGATRRRGPPR
jgi:hypothetical protein